MWYDWDLSSAEREFQPAIALNLNSTPAYWYYGELLRVRQQFDSALSLVRTARSLDPLWPGWPAFAGFLHTSKRHYGEAVEVCQEAVALDSMYAAGQVWLGEALLLAGKPEEACGSSIALRNSG